MSLTPGIWDVSKDFLTSSGEVRACVRNVTSSSNRFTIDAYESDGDYGGLTKLGVFDLQGDQKCVSFYGVVADGTNNKAEVFFRLGRATESDSFVTLDVYED